MCVCVCKNTSLLFFSLFISVSVSSLGLVLKSIFTKHS